MKNFIIITLLTLLGMGQTWSQSAIDRYYQDFRTNDQFTHVSVSSKMFDLFVNFEREDPDEQKIIDIISRLKGLKVLVGKSMEDARQTYNTAVGFPYADMEELMEISESGKEFRFFISERSGQISELLMVGYEGENVFMLSLVGDIDLKEIAELSKKMNIEGFEHFENVDR